MVQGKIFRCATPRKTREESVATNIFWRCRSLKRSELLAQRNGCVTHCRFLSRKLLNNDNFFKVLKYSQKNRPLSRKLLRGDTDSVVVVGGGIGRFAPDPPPNSTLGRGHFDQNTKRSDVLPGEIYSFFITL